MSDSCSVDSPKKSVRTRKAISININTNPQQKTKNSARGTSVIRPKTAQKIAVQSKNQNPIPSYIGKNYQSNNSARSLTTSFPQKKRSFLDDAELNELRETLFRDKSEVSDLSDKKLADLVCHLKEYAINAAKQRDYDNASLANSLLELVNAERNSRSSAVNVNKALEEQYEKRLYQLKQDHKKQRDDFEEEFSFKRQQMEQKLEVDIVNFERLWSNEMPRKYRKPSTFLLKLYDKESRLAKSKDFDAAKEAKIEVDMREQKEMELAQKQMNYDYQIAKEKLIKKQEEERDIFESTYNHYLECLIAKQRIELSHISNRLHVVSLRQEENLKHQQNQKVHTSTQPISREVVQIDHQRLLPPLIAPNDQRMIDKCNKERKEKIQRNKQIKSHIDKVRREKETLIEASQVARENKKENRRSISNMQRDVNSKSNEKSRKPELFITSDEHKPSIPETEGEKNRVAIASS